MGSSKTLTQHDVSSDIGALCRQIEQWRRTRRRGRRMPEPLWRSAARLAGQYSVARISKLARLDYYTLKERGDALVRDSVDGSDKRPAFVELALPPSLPMPECVVELEHPRGGCMRIHIKGGDLPDLAALSRSLWSTGA